ncbi:Hypothetical protein ING2D1G_0289 [Peptoniphilus sp. ING2-D1G]|nr:Hypothetical protein ING2D1G_0289 [Peptoniphilus sp. ING2-D1G]
MGDGTNANPEYIYRNTEPLAYNNEDIYKTYIENSKDSYSVIEKMEGVKTVKAWNPNFRFQLNDGTGLGVLTTEITAYRDGNQTIYYAVKELNNTGKYYIKNGDTVTKTTPADVDTLTEIGVYKIENADSDMAQVSFISKKDFFTLEEREDSTLIEKSGEAFDIVVSNFRTNSYTDDTETILYYGKTAAAHAFGPYEKVSDKDQAGTNYPSTKYREYIKTSFKPNVVKNPSLELYDAETLQWVGKPAKVSPNYL